MEDRLPVSAPLHTPRLNEFCANGQGLFANPLFHDRLLTLRAIDSAPTDLSATISSSCRTYASR